MPAVIGPTTGIAFMVSATLTYDVIAKACSSPQTAELNAQKRAATLMKWVNIGTIEGLALVAVAAFVTAPNRNAIIAGGAVAAGITYAEYLHARKAGLENPGSPTESW